MNRIRDSIRLLLPVLLACGGCVYHAREAADRSVREMSGRPFDLAPDTANPKSTSAAPKPSLPADLVVAMDVQTSAFMTADPAQPKKYQLEVPKSIPGSDAPLIKLPEDPDERRKVLRAFYPELPPLPPEIKPLPGPDGKPYTLADFQRIAAENSPELRQAAADVVAARGNMIQTTTYPNPNFYVQSQPSNNGETPGVWGFYLDQKVLNGGKMKLQTASAKMDLENAQLALKKARSDLATRVRSNYYSLLVSKETMRVTRGLSVLTDEVYQVQLILAERGGFSAAYEPAPLSAQAYAARLAYTQATATYVLNWKQMVAAIGLRQLPLSEVAGRIDAAIPYYEYDKLLARVLTTHTDMISARNGIEKQRYNLKLNQVTPYAPDFDVQVGVYKEFSLAPFQQFPQVSIGAPIPLWDQNRGNILAAEANLARAIEEPHRVELNLTNNLANAFTNYKTNLDALEAYRKHILPNQVIAYRGVLGRRQVDVADQIAQFGNLVAAQQTLSTTVTTYLTILNQLWAGVVNVADLLQTDDLFQLAEARGLPPLPDLDQLPPLPCCHPGAAPIKRMTVQPAAGPAGLEVPPTRQLLPAPRFPSPELTPPAPPPTPAVPPMTAAPAIPAMERAGVNIVQPQSLIPDPPPDRLVGPRAPELPEVPPRPISAPQSPPPVKAQPQTPKPPAPASDTTTEPVWKSLTPTSAPARADAATGN